MAMEHSNSLSVIKILAESFKIFRGNARLLAPNTLFFASNYLMFLGKLITQIPFITDSLSDLSLVRIKDPASLLHLQLLIQTKTYLWRISLASVMFELVVFCSISVFCQVTNIHATAAAYTRKSPSYQDLILMSKSTWRRGMSTWLLVTFFTVIYNLTTLLALGLASFWVVSAFGSIKSCFFIVSGSTTVLVVVPLALYFMFYLDLVSALALVISVVEEDRCGARAVRRAEELIKGRRVQGLALALVLNLLSLPVSAPLAFWLIADPKLPIDIRLLFGFVVIVLNCLVSSVFGIVVHTVFYLQCKKSHGDGEILHQEPELMYAKLGALHVAGV